MEELYRVFHDFVMESEVAKRLPDWLVGSLIDDIFLAYYKHAGEYESPARYMFIVFVNTARMWLDGKRIHCLEGDYRKSACVEYVDEYSLRMHEVADMQSDYGDMEAMYEDEKIDDSERLRMAYESLSKKDRYLFRLLFDELDMPVDVYDKYIKFKDDGLEIEMSGRPVGCYGESGSLLRVYPSAYQAAKELGLSQPSLVAALRSGSRCGNYKWKYLRKGVKRDTNRSIPVVQLTKDGEFVREWKSAAEAAESFGFSSANICNCCKGKAKTAGGFKWKYKDCK